MEILHVSAECYPFAKIGGLADVVGALPVYQNKAGYISKVVLPMYKTPFLHSNQFNVVHKGNFTLGNYTSEFTVIKEKTNKLGYDLYLVDVFGVLDRPNVYGDNDDAEKFLIFQICVLNWLNQWNHLPNVVHCHDHHTGLLPFMMQFSYEYQKLSNIKTVFTIHNAQYQGWMGWDKMNLLPNFDSWKTGMLDWNNTINPLASAIKCASRVTTVSHSYLQELFFNANGLEKLIASEHQKCVGIVNGIDEAVWNPATDIYLKHHYKPINCQQGKSKNKKLVCEQFGLNENYPLFIFIGRLVQEKAADLLPQAIYETLHIHQQNANFLILGSGDKYLENTFTEMKSNFFGYYNATIGYNETLSHQMYAAADFLLMPSRIEPCGLNQLYALKYGTVPIVRNTGGLKDTVVDIGDWEGYGIKFNNASVGDIVYSIGRAISLFQNKEELNRIQQFAMNLNFSWENCVQQYHQVYTN